MRRKGVMWLVEEVTRLSSLLAMLVGLMEESSMCFMSARLRTCVSNLESFILLDLQCLRLTLASMILCVLLEMSLFM